MTASMFVISPLSTSTLKRDEMLMTAILKSVLIVALTFISQMLNISRAQTSPLRPLAVR